MNKKFGTWLEIDVEALKHNFYKISKNVKIMCVVKADAYGHGAVFLSRLYEKLKANYLAVSNINEAIQIRKAKVKTPILILGYTPSIFVSKLLKYNLTQTIMSLNFAKKISKKAEKLNSKITVHIKVDTGMTRLGLLYQDENLKTIEEIKKIRKLKGLNIEGIFTHFSCSDNENFYDYTYFQFENFKNLLKKIDNFKIKHCSNSAAFIMYKEMNMDMIRPGIILYGLLPFPKNKIKINLKQIACWKATISQIKTIKKGANISYNKSFIAKKDMKIAIVPVGYADGYPRSLSNKSHMTVCKEKAPVIGKICMDQLILDVSNVKNITEKSIVTIFGKEKNDISIDELSRLSNTINYEFCCGIGKRVTRFYVKQGKILKRLNYVY